MKSILSAALTLLTTALTAVAGTPHVYTNPAGGEFPILGWSSIHGMENQTPERYREMRDCGFNLALPLTDSISEIVAALDASRGTGISIVAGAAELYADPEATVALIGGHPQLAGYFIKRAEISSVSRAGTHGGTHPRRRRLAAAVHESVPDLCPGRNCRHR